MARYVIDLPEPFDHFVSTYADGSLAQCGCGETQNLEAHFRATRA